MEGIGDFEYSKKDLIGHGAFAVVFKGRHKKKHDFVVAIKCITKKNLAKSQNLLSKEIKILKELSGLQHENVVALLDCKETSHHVYLVMEYCNGGDLADYLQVKGTLSEDTISHFLHQMAGAMKALNAKGIVHRDLKPQNILLCHTGKPNPPPSQIRLKIADFGFARFLQDGVMAATLCGSPMYMAPEVIMSIAYDAKADLWSVGTIVYQCLTGKAPFQAQTPQQLKQFYEKNANLQPNVPQGTSAELKELLHRLLKRNAKDRIEFDDFFNHPFLNPSVKASSPVPVPRSRSRSSIAESPRAVSASPLAGNVFNTPPNPPTGGKVKEAPEPMDVGSSHEGAAGGFMRTPHKDSPSHLPGGGAPASGAAGGLAPEPEDFVMVPENLPSSHLVGSDGSAQRPQSPVDLNAIFSDASPDSPRPSSIARAVRISPGSGEVTYTKRNSSPSPQTPMSASPGRPSSLPVQSPVASTPLSQPIPVPTQVKAYEQIQRSHSSCSPSSPMAQKLGSSPKRTASVQGMAIPRKLSTGSIASLGSISPPQVQFTIGTPPGSSHPRRNSGTFTATPPPSNSPMKRQGNTPPRMSTPTMTGVAPLPTIIGSPTKQMTGFHYPDTTAQSPMEKESPSSPLSAPFGGLNGRVKTCPDNIAAVGYNPDTERRIIPVNSESGSMFRRSGSAGKLSEQLMRAFNTAGPQTVLPPQLTQVTGSNMVVPYVASSSSQSVSTSMQQAGSVGSFVPQDRSAFASGAPPQGAAASRQRCYSCGHEDGAAAADDGAAAGAGGGYMAQSPPNMEGPIMFVAPELAEETLMDKEHKETVAKLSFVLTLVESIIELAQSRSSPLSQSMTSPNQQQQQQQGHQQMGTSPVFPSLDHVTFATEKQRQMEQLVLYVRALQLLSSSIQLAKEELKSGRLQASNSLKAVLRDMNEYYHQCLAVCKNLHNRGAHTNADFSPQAAITADKLIYNYAIEMCQTAAVDELFGNPQECCRRYKNAQILLHSLSQQAHDEHDKELLNKYRESVEKRLYQLCNQGFLQAYDSSTSSS